MWWDVFVFDSFWDERRSTLPISSCRMTRYDTNMYVYQVLESR